MIRPKLTAPGRAHQEVEHPALLEALIQATEQLLVEHGPEGITAIRIAARAGVSMSTLFQCFRNKDAIIAEAMARRRRAEAPPSPDPRAQAPAPSRPTAAAPRTPEAPPVRTPEAPPVRMAGAPVRAAGAPPVRAAGAPPVRAAGAPPVRAAGAPPVRASGAPPVRTAGAPPVRTAGVPPVRAPAPPPASALFRAPAPPKPEFRDAEPRPAISRLPRQPTPAARPAPQAPAPRETLEDAISSVVRPAVTAFAALVPTLAGMPQADRDAINRVELKRLAVASEAMLARQQVPEPAHVAHVMTLACDKVIKDAMRHAPESFADGRLEQALCRLCLDFVRE